MDNLTLEILLNLLKERQYRELRAAIAQENEADIAALVEELEQDAAITVFRMLPKELAAEVFSNLSSDMQKLIIDSFALTAS